MTTTQGPSYLCLFCGDEPYLCDTWKEALEQIKIAVDQRISDFLRQDLPLKVTPEIAEGFDIKVWQLNDVDEVVLPLQHLVDKYYEDMQARETQDLLREFKTHLRLTKKFGGVPAGKLEELLEATQKAKSKMAFEQLLKAYKDLKSD